MVIDPTNPDETDNATQEESVWRDGAYLVFRRREPDLPDQCILCNAPAEGKRVTSGVRDPVAILEHARVEVGLCPDHWSKEAWAQRRPWMLGLLGIGLLALADFLSDSGIPFLETVTAFLGILLLAAAGLLAKLKGKLLKAKRVERQFVWLEDIHPNYLAELPDLAEEPETETQA